jgi:hypothetical protein
LDVETTAIAPGITASEMFRERTAAALEELMSAIAPRQAPPIRGERIPPVESSTRRNPR